VILPANTVYGPERASAIIRLAAQLQFLDCGCCPTQFLEVANEKAIGSSGGAIRVTMGIPVLALEQPQEIKQEEQKPKLMDIKGTVKSDGDKITFVTDSDGKSWDVVNPEILKDHVGHHVELSAHVYADKGQIHVMKVTMIKE
jgi:hypothetical protein